MVMPSEDMSMPAMSWLMPGMSWLMSMPGMDCAMAGVADRSISNAMRRMTDFL